MVKEEKGLGKGEQPKKKEKPVYRKSRYRSGEDYETSSRGYKDHIDGA